MTVTVVAQGGWFITGRLYSLMVASQEQSAN